MVTDFIYSITSFSDVSTEIRLLSIGNIPSLLLGLDLPVSPFLAISVLCIASFLVRVVVSVIRR